MHEITLSSNLDQIELEINYHKQLAGQSIWEIGRRLNHVKENDLAHGQFGNWLEKIGINHSEANRFMKVAKELPNSDTWHNLGGRALYLIATLPEGEREKEQITVKGETKTPDEMTVRELQELKKQLKEKDQQINNLVEVIDTMEHVEPVVVEVPIEKIPEDYTTTKTENENLMARNKELETNYHQLLIERQEVDEKSEKYERLTKAINQAQGKLNDTQKLISDYKKLSDLIEQSNAFLSKASALVYQDLSEVINRDGLAKRELGFLTERLEKFLLDLKKVSDTTILEGEIANE